MGGVRAANAVAEAIAGLALAEPSDGGNARPRKIVTKIFATSVSYWLEPDQLRTRSHGTPGF